MVLVKITCLSWITGRQEARRPSIAWDSPQLRPHRWTTVILKRTWVDPILQYFWHIRYFWHDSCRHSRKKKKLVETRFSEMAVMSETRPWLAIADLVYIICWALGSTICAYKDPYHCHLYYITMQLATHAQTFHSKCTSNSKVDICCVLVDFTQTATG